MNGGPARRVAGYLGAGIVLFFACTAFAEPRVLLSRPLTSNLSSLTVLEAGEATEVSVRTPEGKVRLRLRRLKSAAPIVTTSPASDVREFDHPRLFQGASLSRRGAVKRWVAADFSGNKLRVWFVGPLRARLFQLEQSSGEPPRLHHLPSRMTIGCLAPIGNTRAPESWRAPSLSTAAASGSRNISVAADADFEFVLRYKARSLTEMLGRINVADAIYRTQLGLRLEPRRVHLFASSRQPYDATGATGLLLQFQDYSERRDHLGRGDVYHLFSGRALGLGIIGLAFLGEVCLEGGSFSYSLSASTNSVIAPLVFAHEVGHLLGAQHPEDLLGSGIMPSLMTSFVQPGQSNFSDFSREEIAQTLADHGSCIN